MYNEYISIMYFRIQQKIKETYHHLEQYLDENGMTREEVLKIIYETIYQYFDVCSDEEETPISDKDKLLLEINKSISNKIKENWRTE